MLKTTERSRGYVMLGTLFLLALGLIISSAMLDSTATNTKTRALVKTRADYYYDVEATLHKTVSWLQTHSKYIVTAFKEDAFGLNFDLGSPSLGDNEGEHFSVPTMVKLKGTNNSAMLSNNDFFGVSAFPTLTHIDNGGTFDAINAFKEADLGSANVRVIMTWARYTDSNYEPIFRIDVVTGNNPDRGVHSFSYVYTTLVASGGVFGFYGRNALTLGSPNNDCYSHQYSYNEANGTWNRGAPRANCTVGSEGPVNIKSDVHGTVKTLQDNGIHLNPPGGSVTGETCAGADCHSFTMPTFGTWEDYCPGVTTDLTVSSNTTIATGTCLRNVSVNNQRTITLSDYENPYYIKLLTLNGNFARFSPGNIPPGEKVTIYLETLDGNHINGNGFYNAQNAPHQLIINYIGINPLTLNGTAAINGVIVAPKTSVTLNGNFNFYGGIMTEQLNVSGNARINFDEQLAEAPVLKDLNFALRKASQRYR